jgi:hypothetical protein
MALEQVQPPGASNALQAGPGPLMSVPGGLLPRGSCLCREEAASVAGV